MQVIYIALLIAIMVLIVERIQTALNIQENNAAEILLILTLIVIIPILIFVWIMNSLKAPFMQEMNIGMDNAQGLQY